MPPKSARVYVGRLTRSVTKEHIQEIFSAYGPIKHVEMPVDVIHAHSIFNRGFAYIEFEKAEDAERSCKYMDGGQIDGQEVTANISVAPPPKPAVIEPIRDRQRNPSPPRRQRSPPRRYRPSPDRRGPGAGYRARSPPGRGGRRSRSPVSRRSRSPRNGGGGGSRRPRNRSASSESSN